LYIVETYKTAAKTYLAALTQQPAKGAVWTEKAIGVVRALNARAVRSGDAKAKRDVVNMYRSIAVQLEKQLAETRDPEVRKQFVNNLNQFLKTLQSESDDANTVIWVGKTLMSLGDSFMQQEMTDQAKPLYTSAVAALDRAATMDVQGDKLKAELRRQQAIAKRSVGKFEDSYKELVTLLKESPNAWHIQMDAAKTLQQWGMVTKTKGPLVKALTGAEKVRDEKTKRQSKLVWGWSRLAEAFKNSEKHKEAYYTSLMAAVQTRFEYGVIDGNRKIMAAALKRLTIARNKDGEMGGPQWKPQFDELEKQIKQKMNTM
jgi:tetratricopeptide (TPR) repeat protein